MKYTLVFIIAVATSLLVGWLIPFWGSLSGPVLVGIILKMKERHHFFSGMAIIFLLWTASAVHYYLQDANNFADKMAELFSLSQGWILIGVTALVGGISGGLVQWTVSNLKVLLIESRNK